MLEVRLRRVVEARVELPETARLVKLRVPAFNVVNAAMPPVMFPTVVLPRVVDPVAQRFVEKSDEKPPMPAVRFNTVVEASVEEPVAKKLTPL